MAEKIKCWEFNECGRVTGEAYINEPVPCSKKKNTAVSDVRENGSSMHRDTSCIFSGRSKSLFARLRFSCMNCTFFKPDRREEGFTEIFFLNPHQKLQ
ncbi:MAG: hypothetical protein ABFR82_06675 [Nitrospirota bacterium]